MAKGILLVESRPVDPGREDEYNDWYTNTHIPQVCAIPGCVGARRYKVHGDADPSAYVAIYDIEAEDLAQPMVELRERSVAGMIALSDAMAMDPPPVVTLYDLIE